MKSSVNLFKVLLMMIIVYLLVSLVAGVIGMNFNKL
jgi:hypothetical protein